MVSLHTPDLRSALAAVERRLGILERRIVSRTATATAASQTIVFSHSGALTAGTSPPVRRNGILAVVAVELGTAGSTDTTLTIERDGTVVATVTVPSGSASYTAEVAVRYTGHRLTLTVAGAGTGAADMVAEARYT